MEKDATLNEVIKLYINHRPVIGMNSQDIEDAFAVISKKYVLNTNITFLSFFCYNVMYRFSLNPEKVSYSELQKILLSEGEFFTNVDLESCISTLLGEKGMEEFSRTQFNSQVFANQILGFEEANNGIQ